MLFETLERSLRKAAVRSFQIVFTGLRWVSNFEHNRWFLVLSIKRPAHDELNRLLNACNEAAGKCGYPGLYTGGEGDGPMHEDRSQKRRRSEVAEEESVDYSTFFHVSIAWNLTEPDPDWASLVENLGITKHICSTESPVVAVKAKIGNVVHNIPLRNRE